MITFESTKRITKLLVDGKHRKSFPLVLDRCLNKIDINLVNKFEKSLRLKDKDVILISHIVFPYLLELFYKQLQKEEYYVFERIGNSIVVGCREVISRDGNRFELCLDNGLKIKIDELLYRFSIVKLTVAYLNY